MWRFSEPFSIQENFDIQRLHDVQIRRHKLGSRVGPKWIKLDQTWSNWISHQSKSVTIKSCHIYKKDKNGRFIFDLFGWDLSKMVNLEVLQWVQCCCFFKNETRCEFDKQIYIRILIGILKNSHTILKLNKCSKVRLYSVFLLV